ncbi:MAG: hypothetical protein ACREKN_02125 [Longimicrobiaceae bacterium]
MKALAALLITVLVLLFGCTSTGLDVRRQFVLAADSVTVPDTTASGDPLPVRLTGVVGDSDCYSFLEIRSERLADTLRLAAIGLYQVDERGCNSGPVPYDETHQADPPFPPGAFIVEVLQPGGNIIEDTVWVEEG